jgi:hypothetical protein
MANKLLIKRSAVPAKVPTTSDLDLGELAINTYDGKVYIKKDSGTASIAQVGGGAVTSSGLTMATNRLLGRTTASTGAVEEITVGSGLTLSSGTLTASGGSGTVTSVSGTGAVNGITLTGTVTSSGSLTLGGTLSGVSLTSQVTDTLPATNGGTGNNTYAVGDILYASATDTLTRLPAGQAGTVLLSSSTTSAPVWSIPTVKRPVRVVATTSITLSGLQTIDGITLAANDRVLVVGQTAPAENGIYNALSGAWTRNVELNDAGEATAAVVAISSGTTFGGTIWRTNFKATDTLGTTAMNWYRVLDTGQTVSLVNGGTNANLTAVNGGVLYSGASALALTAAGTTGQVLTSTGAGAPTWQTPSGGITVSETAPSSPTDGQVWYQPSTNKMFVYTVDTGVVMTQRGTGITQTGWTNPQNAYDAGTNTPATWSSTVANEANTIYITGYGFDALPSTATINSVSVTTKQYVSATNRMNAPSIQPYVGSTAVGTLTTLSNSASTSNSQTTTQNTLTLAQLRDPTFQMQFNAVHYNGTISGTQNLDYIDVSVNYTAAYWKELIDNDSSQTIGGTKTFTDGALVAGTGTLGYSGNGGTVTQATSRTTAVTINRPTGQITLFSAAGTTTWTTFTVTDGYVASTDVIIVNQQSGTNLYEVHATAVNNGSFNLSFRTTGGTATDAPTFNFIVLKGAIA